MHELTVTQYRTAIGGALGRLRGGELTSLAERAGVSRALVYRLRSQKRPNVCIDTLERLERALREEAEQGASQR
jgi:transcriptional regulator with XRE-family HTH domain